MMGEVDEPRAIDVLTLKALDKLVKLYGLVCDVLRALLVVVEAERVAALVHVQGAQAEAEQAVFAGLARALPVALAVDELLVGAALLDDVEARPHADPVVVNRPIWADRRTNVALGDDKALGAYGEPLVFTHLATVAALALAVAPPQAERLLTAMVRLLKELWTHEVWELVSGVLRRAPVNIGISLVPHL